MTFGREIKFTSMDEWMFPCAYSIKQEMTTESPIDIWVTLHIPVHYPETQLVKQMKKDGIHYFGTLHIRKTPFELVVEQLDVVSKTYGHYLLQEEKEALDRVEMEMMALALHFLIDHDFIMRPERDILHVHVPITRINTLASTWIAMCFNIHDTTDTQTWWKATIQHVLESVDNKLHVDKK
jgi:hypothetical protein